MSYNFKNLNIKVFISIAVQTQQKMTKHKHRYGTSQTFPYILKITKFLRNIPVRER